jgi:asparagine synthetase B (glutamine-hydrolysing)
VLFASELKAILAVWPRAGAPPWRSACNTWKSFNTGEQSLVRGIRRLPPGRRWWWTPT